MDLIIEKKLFNEKLKYLEFIKVSNRLAKILKFEPHEIECQYVDNDEQIIINPEDVSDNYTVLSKSFDTDKLVPNETVLEVTFNLLATTACFVTDVVPRELKLKSHKGKPYTVSIDKVISGEIKIKLVDIVEVL